MIGDGTYKKINEKYFPFLAELTLAGLGAFTCA